MQNSDTDKNTSVLIVGAGPSGLMMACQLALRNIPFRLIDKKAQPANYSGALIVHARSVELFQQMGIAEAAIRKGIIANEIKLIFNGKKSFVIPIGDIGSGLSQFPYLLLLEQSETEQLLIDFIHDHGYQVERKTELLRFSQDSEEVISTLKYESGEEETLKSRYLIAADGAHSTIRKQLQIPFEGKAHLISLFVSVSNPVVNFPHDQICFSFSDETTAGFFPLPDGRWRIDGAISGEMGKNDTLTYGNIKNNFGERTRLQIRLPDPEWFSVFRIHQRIASGYRQNRCFLVGDAAHIHSPVGAQGMNTGMQDASNLAWKLALVIQKKANDRLLSTYTSERIGIARNIARYTGWIFNFVTGRNYFIQYFRVRLLPFLLKLVYPLLGKNTAMRHSFFRNISEIGIHYRKSSLSNKASFGEFPSPAPRPGDRVPWFSYTENGKKVNIQEKLKGNDFQLFIFARQTVPEEIVRVAEKYSGLISLNIFPCTSETTLLYERFGIGNFGYYLVRPDMYIAFRSAKPLAEDLESYLQQYFSV